MPFEEFDDRIKEAAENHHPAYDEKAWAGMESKLNRHMPVQKDDRRKGFILLFFTLLTGAGIWLLTSRPWKNDPLGAATQTGETTKGEWPVQANKKNPGAPASTDFATSNTAEKTVSTPVKGSAIQTNATEQGNTNKPEKKVMVTSEQQATADASPAQRTSPIPIAGKQKQPVATKAGRNHPFAVVVTNAGVAKQKKDGRNAADKNDKEKENLPDATAPSERIIPAPAMVNTETMNEQDITKTGMQPAADTGLLTITAPVQHPQQKPAAADIALPATTKTVKQRKKATLFLAVSAGPDASGVSYSRLGKPTLAYGIGAGITFKNRLTIRTGFYTAKKLYVADSADYNPPAGWWRYYPNMQSIDADCRVYELPLLVSYQFAAKKKHAWLATAGISSVYMKRETYTYNYKYWGLPVSKTMTFTNENKHFLSVLTLSGGYAYQLSPRISVLAEPYLKLPVSGIGFGNIKLNSAGVLFSVAVQPFARK